MLQRYTWNVSLLPAHTTWPLDSTDTHANCTGSGVTNVRKFRYLHADESV